MSSSRALLLKGKQCAFELGRRALPTPGHGEILVKEITAGLNSVDWKIQDYGIFVSNYLAIPGVDAAGEVEAVGEGVTHFKKSERFHQGGFSGGYDGTFQEYVLVLAEIASKLPANIIFDQAASLLIGVGMVVVPLYSPSLASFGLKAPWDGGRGQSAGQPILVIGGSGSVGRYTTQFAWPSGFSPTIATASLRNTDLLKSLGATHVIDRNISSTFAFATEIARITLKPIALVYDAIASADTQQLGYDVLAEGGHILVTLSSSINETHGSAKRVLSVFGNAHTPANREIERVLAQNLPALVKAGDIVPNPVEVLPGGLNGIVARLDKLRNNLVREEADCSSRGDSVIATVFHDAAEILLYDEYSCVSLPCTISPEFVKRIPRIQGRKLLDYQ